MGLQTHTSCLLPSRYSLGFQLCTPQGPKSLVLSEDHGREVWSLLFALSKLRPAPQAYFSTPGFALAGPFSTKIIESGQSLCWNRELLSNVIDMPLGLCTCCSLSPSQSIGATSTENPSCGAPIPPCCPLALQNLGSRQASGALMPSESPRDRSSLRTGGSGHTISGRRCSLS